MQSSPIRSGLVPACMEENAGSNGPNILEISASIALVTALAMA